LRDCCNVGPAEQVGKPELFEAWREWNLDRGRDAGEERAFGRELHLTLPQLRDARPRAGEQRLRLYVGIGVRPRDLWAGADSAA
jgi:hypothetical protein